MTDNEIIKALECCLLSNEQQEERCAECPMCETPLTVCQHLLSYHALDLINRQKAEIERYEKENNAEFKKWEILAERTKELYHDLYEEAKGVVRAETTKEFVKLFEKKIKDVQFTLGQAWEIQCALKDVAKEMTGDNDE